MRLDIDWESNLTTNKALLLPLRRCPLWFPDLPERVLLANPPVYDTRFEWSQWHQPSLLLKIGNILKKLGSDARLIDSLEPVPGRQLPRKQVNILDLDGIPLIKWRYGRSRFAVQNAYKKLAKSGWIPDRIFVEGYTTFWWEGVAEIVEIARAIFNTSEIWIVGAYPKYAREHVSKHMQADHIITTLPLSINSIPTDFSLYTTIPKFATLTLGGDPKNVVGIINDIRQKNVSYQISEFVVTNFLNTRYYLDEFVKLLEAVIREQLPIKFHALGNISPFDLVDKPYLASLMKRAGYRTITFADDRDLPNDPNTTNDLIDSYRVTAELCHRAGFQPRTKELCGSISIGRLGDSLRQRAELSTRISHSIGSVIAWPYQPEPIDYPDIPLEILNCKLFPLRMMNGYQYIDYANFLGFVAMLNAKYRSCTFDFLGNNFVSSLFRDRLQNRGWEPNPSIKGDLIKVVYRHD